MQPKVTRIDIVAAVRNEEACLPWFVESIQKLDLPPSVTLGIIFIEDSSTDRTLEVLRELSRTHPSVRFHSLREGQGQCPAIVYGMSRSDADAVITMDIDGGHAVSLVPEMIREFLAGTEIVQAIRTELRNRRAYREIGGKAFSAAMYILTGVDLRKQNVYFRLVSRRCKNLIVERKRWIYFLRIPSGNALGASVRHVTFSAEDRVAGAGKYRFTRLLKLSVDAVLSLMSGPRFCLLIAACLLCGVAAWIWVGIWPALILWAIACLTTFRYLQMTHNSILRELEVKETSERQE